MSTTASAAITAVAIDSIRPSKENWEIYRRPEADQDIPALAESIREIGIQQPLIVSEDLVIVSGHRRHSAAKLAGLTHVPVIIMQGEMRDLTDAERVKLLIDHNKGSRVKTAAETVAEAMAGIDPELAIEEARLRKSQVYTMAQTSTDRVIVTTTGNRRTDPRKQRGEFLAAVIEILESLLDRDMLPTSERHINYKLLGIAPRVSKGRKGIPYGTDPKGDPGKLSKLLTDARSAGIIPHSWITDETRGDYAIEHSGGIGDYVASATEDLFGNYFYNVHEDQPAHIELLVEKNTMFELIRKHIANKYRIPLTSCRGYSSFPVSCRIAERFRKSGKDHLVIITICDHDPEGFDMPQAMKKYIEIDHGIKAEIDRAAITTDQIRKYNLPPCIGAKEKSARFKNYVKQTGMTDAWELDALEPEFLIQEVDRKVRSFLNIEAFNAAWQRENEADLKLATLRAAIAKQVPSLMAEIESSIMKKSNP
jgi:hypothetical protein